MATAKKTSATDLLIDEALESKTQILLHPDEREDADPLAEFKCETLAALLDEQEKLRQTLMEHFGVSAEAAADLVIGMADMCREFSHFIVKAGSYQVEGTTPELENLLHNFFNHRGWGLSEGHRVFADIPMPWSTHFLNEFLLNTVTSEIPFVYLAGEKVEVLTIPDQAFWMDFKASLQATGDWDRLQSWSNKNLNARSMSGHAAKTALGCLLARMGVSYPADALDVLFTYIDTPRLLEIFMWPFDELQDDEAEAGETVAGEDYEWGDFLALLGEEADPESVNLHTPRQVDEFMSIYKDFRGTFTGYEIDQHGILRYREFQGWLEYVRYKNRYPNPARKDRHSIH